MKRLQKILNAILPPFLRKEEGSTLPIAGMAFPVVLGFVGLGTDASLWMSQKLELQNAADSSVLSASWEYAYEADDQRSTLGDGVESASNAAYMGQREAIRNGFDMSANGQFMIQTVGTNDAGTTLQVNLSQDAQMFFSQIIFQDGVRINAEARALVETVEGNFCILALEEIDASSLTVQGAVNINAPGCGLAINSSDVEALTLKGNVEVTVDTVRITGDYDINGSVDFYYNDLQTGKRALADPYADLEVPDYGGCDHTSLTVNSSTTLSPGVYCDGLNISGTNDVVFEPGVYIFDGGTFKVTGGGTLTGEGVTLIFTGSGSDYAQMDVSGSREVSFSAPLAGEEFAGIVFFQDRNAPQDDSNQNKLVGTSSIEFNGVAYFPSQGLWLGGDNEFTGGDAPCTRVIARTVTFAGSPSLGNACEAYDTEAIGDPYVKLVY